MPHLKTFKKPLAIAMWDFSWMLRHQKGDSFYDFDEVLDGLVKRGYNAVRIDVFPQFIGRDPEDGSYCDNYTFTRPDMTFQLWGNNYTLHNISPRKALKEFMQKCEKHGVYVGLSTWFFGDDKQRNLKYKSLDSFITAWDDVLEFLKSENLLNNVIYVDLLNEYPMYHGFNWFMDAIKELGTAETPEIGKQFNATQIKFYNDFLTTALKRLKSKWPELTIFTSQTEIGDVPFTDVDFTEFMAIDKHMWMCLVPGVADLIDYWNGVMGAKTDKLFAAVTRDIQEKWPKERDRFAKELAKYIKQAGDIAKQYKIPIGNTEGWGGVTWFNHPHLDWEWTKDCAEIAVDACLDNGYTFITTSNFTHPHFTIWDDIKWHQKICDKIKNG